MSQLVKPKILILCDFYLPGFKSGGGMRTLVNMIERLGDDYDFRVVCRDHDGKADKTPYTTVKINAWNSIGKAQVFYVSKENIKLGKVKEIVQEINPKSIYSNSYFSTFTILLLLLRRFKQINDIPIIIAPEGELSDGALQLKKGKKVIYLKMASSLNLYRDIIWKSTAVFEAEESKKFKGTGGKIFIAPNMPPRTIFPEYKQSLKPYKNKGELKLVFLSRVHPKKNLKYLLELLKKIEDAVTLDIYGPINETDYFESCQKIIAELPSNIKVEFKGEVSHEKVSQTLVKYHFFVLPTLGENFGHVFIEALAAGCPLIISDRTPWLDLEKREVGWDLPLEAADKWIDVLKRCLRMDNELYTKVSSNARAFALEWLADAEVENATRKVIEYSLSTTSKNGAENL